MTTLIIDMEAKKLYTDSRVTHRYTGSSVLGIQIKKPTREFKDDYVKVFHSTKDRLITGTGDIDQIKKFRDWLLGKRFFKPRLSDTTVFDCRLTPALTVTRYKCDGSVTKETPDSCKWFTSGSGGDYAAGAIATYEITSEKAMESAKELDSGSGGATIEYDLSGRWYDEDVQ